MKLLNPILTLFIFVTLFAACAPNPQESKEEVEVYIEDPVATDDNTPVEAEPTTDSAEVVAETTEQTNTKSVDEKEKVDVKAELPDSAEKNQEVVVSKTPTINRKLGTKLSKESDFDLMSYAAEEVALLKKEDCEGEDCGTKIELESISSDKVIVAVVMIRWKEGSKKNKELREYKLKPVSTIDIGCSQSCGEDVTRYSWKIVSAKYN